MYLRLVITYKYRDKRDLVLRNYIRALRAINASSYLLWDVVDSETREIVEDQVIAYVYGEIKEDGLFHELFTDETIAIPREIIEGISKQSDAYSPNIHVIPEEIVKSVIESPTKTMGGQISENGMFFRPNNGGRSVLTTYLDVTPNGASYSTKVLENIIRHSIFGQSNVVKDGRSERIELPFEDYGDDSDIGVEHKAFLDGFIVTNPYYVPGTHKDFQTKLARILEMYIQAGAIDESKEGTYSTEGTYGGSSGGKRLLLK